MFLILIPLIFNKNELIIVKVNIFLNNSNGLWKICNMTQISFVNGKKINEIVILFSSQKISKI